jgi:hypothetical protein
MWVSIDRHAADQHRIGSDAVIMCGLRSLLCVASVGAVALLCGCRNDRAPDLTSRTRGADTNRFCIDSVETRAVACSGQTARRAGDTLFVRLETGGEIIFVDDPASEAPGGYHYAGRIGRAAFHLVESYGHETPPVWIFINARTGRQVGAPDKPIVSPDKMRFVTASESWNNCAELDHPRLEVWRLTDTLPALEWRLDPWSCRTQTGWGPTDPQWAGSDTLRFTRNDMEFPKPVAADTSSQPIYHTRPLLAVRDHNGWHVVGQP